MMALQSIGAKFGHKDSSKESSKDGAKDAAEAASAALSNITNGAIPSKTEAHAVTTATTLGNDDFTAQLVILTNIAKSLQKEMSALTRRSRDNATDLLSLKEATKSRDEDVRKSLRELVGNVNEQSSRMASFSGLYIDNKPHSPGSPPPNPRGFHLPRIPSPKSFSDSLDKQPSMSAQSLSGADSGSSLALLEKILNGLGTKDGNESLVSMLTQLSKKLSGMASSAKVNELVDYVKLSQPDKAMVLSNSSRSLDSASGPMTQRVERLLQNGDSSRRSSAPLGRGLGADLVNEDLMNIIKSVKDSISQGGGLTAEVKALVRELRGEVLGMGRELGKRLETMDSRNIGDAEDAPTKDDVSRVIDQGLEQMKEQLNHMLREHRRQSSQSLSSTKTLIDYQEIYNAMRAALRDNEASAGESPELSREDVIEAVRDAWENYKPEIEVQQLGLERDEVLACLKEGLQEYSAFREERPEGATREEVFKAVVEGVKHFVPPQVETPASLSRDEIIDAVRDCLEEFEFPISAAAVGSDVSHKDMVHAVREGLSGIEFPRGDTTLVGQPMNDEISSRLQDLMNFMKQEFTAVSEEAKQNVAANGRDTEQVLDATKDGLESLRMAIESYVDRASGVAGQDEFLDNLSRTMDEFKEEIAHVMSAAHEGSREQLQTQLDGLHDIVNSSMVPTTARAVGGGANNDEVLEALQGGLNSLRQEILRRRPETSEVLDAIADGLNDIRAGIDRVANKPVDLTANDEILDALRAGLESVRSDIETLRETSGTDRAVAAVANVAPESDRAVVPADIVKQDDIKNLEVLIGHLQIKVEAMSGNEAEGVQRDDVTRLEDMLRDVQKDVSELSARESSASQSNGEGTREAAGRTAASKDDVEAIETILRNTKDRIDDLIDGEQAVRKDHMDNLEAQILETRERIGSLSDHLATMSHKEDLSALEKLVADMSISLEEMKTSSARDMPEGGMATMTGVEAVEAHVLELKAALDGLSDADFSTMPSKEDVSSLEDIVKETKETLDKHTEAATTAMDERQAEIVGVADRVGDVKSLLEEFQEAVHGKLDEGAGGIDALSKALESVTEKLEKNDSVGEDVKEMFESMKTQFEESKEVVAGARLESEEKLQEATDAIGSRIDDKITELVLRYEELKTSLDDRSQSSEARGLETDAAVASTKATTEELKLLVDTLGSTVTDSLEKMEEASKTVFTKVDELASRADESGSSDKNEHVETREHIQQAVTAVTSLQEDVKEHQPKILEAVKDILLLVGEHFEHSKTTTSDLHDKMSEARSVDQAMLPPAEKYDDSSVQEKLSVLADQKYDDSAVHEKLEKLMGHQEASTQAFAQLENIDKVHQSVVNTAAEISQFLSSQKQRIEEDHEDRERALQETKAELDRKLAEKDHVEASVLSLKDEEDRVRKSIVGLRTEHESLIRQKTRLTGDLSSLETALRLRKEELADMEHRAERLERRIVEGVMDHSRVLLMTKGSGKGGKDGSDAMDRKRVKKPATFGGGVDSRNGNTPDKVTPKHRQSKLARPSAVNLALSTSAKSNLPTATGQNGTPRRIVSLSQMNSQSPSSLVKRSQSVRSPNGPTPLRKRSWGGGLGKKLSEEDKENQVSRETVDELDEPETAVPSPAQSMLTPRSLASSMTGGIGEDEGSVLTVTSTVNGDGESDDRRSSVATTVLSSQFTESDVDVAHSEYEDDTAIGTDLSANANAVTVYGQ